MKNGSKTHLSIFFRLSVHLTSSIPSASLSLSSPSLSEAHQEKARNPSGTTQSRRARIAAGSIGMSPLGEIE
jgi:hypothetical protein